MNEAKKIDIDEAAEKQFSAKELMDYKTVTSMFNVFALYTSDEDRIPDVANASRFARGVKVMTALLWVHAHERIRQRINTLNQERDDRIRDILALDEKGNRKYNQQTEKRERVVAEEETAEKIYCLLCRVITESRLNQSVENVSITNEEGGSLDELLSAARSDTSPELNPGA